MPSFERCDSTDTFKDFCLWEYEPLCAPDGKMRSINLLNNTFESTAVDTERALGLCQNIREQLGVNQSVWGVKNVAGNISWELYFYDYERLERKVSISRLLEILKPEINCPLHFDEDKPYFMFSIDLTPESINQSSNLDEINIYIGNVSTAVSSGISYTLSDEGLKLGNLYYFFDRQAHWDDIIGKMACSAHLNLPHIEIASLLWPELTDCQTIVVANKKHNDGLYFSRINIDQLIIFLKKCDYPASIIDYTEKNRDQLDHMLYDVGIDYIMKDGKISILKSAYYGFF